MFYSKYNEKCHIVDNISSLKVENLKQNDQVIILSGQNTVCTTNLTLQEIHYGNKIYDFVVNNNLPTYPNNYWLDNATYSSSSGYSQDILRMYNDNGCLALICNTKYRTNDFGEDGFSVLQKSLKKYVNKYKGQIYANDICTFHKDEHKNTNNLYTYFILPLDDQSFMVLCRTFTITNKKRFYKNDYVMFCNYPSGELHYQTDEIIELFYFNSLYNTYKLHNLGEFFQQLKLSLDNKYTKIFDNAYFISDYCLDITSYLNDNNRDITVKEISKFLNKKLFKNNDFDLQSQYNCVFNHILGIKAYVFNNDITITYNDEIINYGNGCDSEFNDTIIYDQGKCYTIKRPDIIKTNKKLQTLYKIAYSIAEFTKNQNGLNPITGDYYNYSKIKNEEILYKDCKSIIINGNYPTYYIKKYGYFIKSSNKEAKAIEERYNTIQKLSDK